MTTLLAVAAAISGVLAIAADWSERRHKSFYLLKPLTTLLILGIAASAPASVSPLYQKLIVAALLLSMIGDICLMFHGNGWFIGGLSSFLLAHLLFVGAFLDGPQALQVPLWSWLVVPYALALLYWLLPKAGPLKIPVILYCSVIGAMVLTACARYGSIGDTSSLLVAAGSLLFLASDSALAVRQFVGRYAGAQALILSTYWLAIGLIAWSTCTV
jgi:uncharacterized membrane protein YhhN